MKKLVLSLAVLFSVAMVSCGGNKAAEAAEDTAAVAAVEVAEAVVEESVAPESVVAETVVAAEVAEVPAEAAK